ncbi:MAG: sulfatase-like hydrolase/transferase, partial [Planctomycetota bacterium]
VPHMKQWGFEHKKLHDATYNFYSRSADFSDYVQWLQEEKYPDDPGKPIRLAEADERSRGEDKYRFLMGSNWNDEEHHETTWVANESIDYLENYDSEDPFFLFTSFFGPHQPFMPPEPWSDTYTAEDVELPPQLHAEMDNCPIYNVRGRGQREKHMEEFDEQQFRELIAGYYSNIAMIDHYIGNICDTLMEEGMWDDTMIIFTTDHGDHMSKYGMFGKAQMYDSCCRVPLVIKPPAGASGYPDRVDDVVNTLDCYGTCLDAAGDDNWEYDPMEAERIECESLWPFLQGEQPDRDNRTFSIIGGSADDNLCMCREGPLKLIRLARGEKEPLYEMYDLEKNPLETENIYNDPEYRQERDRLRKVLDEWWEEQKQNYERDDVKFGWRKREDSPYK